MSLPTASKILVFGVGVHLGHRAAARVLGPLRARRRDREEPAVMQDTFASDPRDVVQGLDEPIELLGEPLDVDALSNEDAESALDIARSESDREGTALYEAEGDGSSFEGSTAEDGDLYGVHTPPSADRELPDADTAMAQGETWLEALSTSAIEGGPEPERIVDVIDDDPGTAPHQVEGRDIPVADRGSAGPRGL